MTRLANLNHVPDEAPPEADDGDPIGMATLTSAAGFLGEVRAEHGSYQALEERLGVVEAMDQLRQDLLEEA